MGVFVKNENFDLGNFCVQCHLRGVLMFKFWSKRLVGCYFMLSTSWLILYACFVGPNPIIVDWEANAFLGQKWKLCRVLELSALVGKHVPCMKNINYNLKEMQNFMYFFIIKGTKGHMIKKQNWWPFFVL